MKIHVATKTVLRPDADGKNRRAYRKYRELSGGKAEAYDTIAWQAWDIYDYIAPVVGVDQKQTDVVVAVDANTSTFEVVDMTAQEIIDRDATQLDSDLQQATIASAILIQEAFTQMQVAGYLDASTLSDKAKAEFATLTTLVNSYIH